MVRNGQSEEDYVTKWAYLGRAIATNANQVGHILSFSSRMFFGHMPRDRLSKFRMKIAGSMTRYP